jgi:hypothetical protein
MSSIFPIASLTMSSGFKFQDAQKPALGTPALEISAPPRKSVFPIFSNFPKLTPEMEFLNISLTTDSSLLVDAIHSPFY